LNVTEDDILLYEVQSYLMIPSNNKFVFKPKVAKEKKIRNKNFLLEIEPENHKEDYLMSLSLERCLEKHSKAGLTGL
jgi:hypothetical protein